MHWDEELTRLALHKAALQRRIARQRVQCVSAAGRVSRPMARIDRIVAIWRGLPPFVKFGAMPLGIIATRVALPRRGILRSLVRWGPIVYSLARAFGSAKTKGANGRPPVLESWRERQRLV